MRVAPTPVPVTWPPASTTATVASSDRQAITSLADLDSPQTVSRTDAAKLEPRESVVSAGASTTWTGSLQGATEPELQAMGRRRVPLRTADWPPPTIETNRTRGIRFSL